jgi:uncharacterized SAM-binding protein YcdF (DUF218 family)
MKKKCLIIVLGSPNKENGELYSVAKERCELALQIYRKNSACKIILTGGYGDHFNRSKKPHACYLKSYLLKAGIIREDIIACVESTNTREDASLTKSIVEKNKIEKIIIITSDFHEKRARFIFEKEYAELGVPIEFAVSHTISKNCELDLEALIQHEQRALDNLTLEENKSPSKISTIDIN